MSGLGESGAETRNQGRNAFVDCTRGFAIVGVVLVHFGGSFVAPNNAWSASFYTGLALNQLFSFAVPLFVFISGLLAGNFRRQRDVGLGSYYAERLKTIGGPYLVASIAAFFLLGISQELVAIPTVREKISWVFLKVTYYGVHPTFYFIPMIIVLYLFKPAFLSSAQLLHRLLTKEKERGGQDQSGAIVFILASLFSLHIAIGLLCYFGKLDYYTWCRPNPIFWAFYFYFGLVFKTVSDKMNARVLAGVIATALIVALVGYLLDWNELSNRVLVGANFEHSKIDYAYSRPVIMLVDLSVVVVIAGLLAKGVSLNIPALSYLGRFSLHIYLWHIIVLFFLAWKHEFVLSGVKSAPELILFIAVFCSFLIAGAVAGLVYISRLPGRVAVFIRVSKL